MKTKNISKLALFLLLFTAMLGKRNSYAMGMSEEERFKAAQEQLKMHVRLNKESGYADSGVVCGKVQGTTLRMHDYHL